MKTTHTPGPWGVESEFQAIVTACNGRLSVCEVHDHNATSETHTAAEAEANARLIAAAPDLLAACKEAVDQLRFYDGLVTIKNHDIELIGRLDAAIAKYEANQ